MEFCVSSTQNERGLPMYCSICGIETESIEAGIDEEWLPSYWDGDVQHEVACFSCSESVIRIGEDGEYEVKPEYQGKIVYQDTESRDHHFVMGVALGFDARNN